MIAPATQTAAPPAGSKSGATVAVVGGGLGGLAAAATLAARGYKVTLFDRNPWLGGKAARYEDGGYRFDMGPTILTLPAVLKRIFAEAGKDLADYCEIVPLDPQWRCFFDPRSEGKNGAGGGVLDLTADQDAMKANLDEFTGAENTSKGYAAFLEYAKRLNGVSDRFFFYKNVGGIRDTLKLGGMFNLEVLSDLRALKMGKSVAKTVRSHIDDPRVAQMVDHYTQYVGSCPEQSPAVLCGIADMQTTGGVWYPIGGTRAVPEALVKLGEELGVDYRPGSHVEEITRENGKVTGLKTADGESHRFDAVVSNSDTVRTHRELLDGPPAEKFLKKDREPACSGVVLYLGLKKKYDHLLHHNFVFSADPHAEFEQIYTKGEPADDPTAYVCAPAVTEPAVAPEGGEALYVLVHTPFLRDHHDWRAIFPAYRQKILEKLKSTAGMEDIEDRIEVEHHLTPQDIHDRYHVLNGAIYGLASHGTYLGAFKPANRSRDVAGLYFAGGSAHPGPGMPMVMMSGWTAADTLDRDGVAAG